MEYIFSKKALTTRVICVIMVAVLLAARPVAVKAAMPVNKKVVVIDAGHGEWDPGKTGGGVREKDINLVISEKLQTLLEIGGAVVFVTRAEDTALSERKRGDLTARAELANGFKADIFISVHQNSFENPSVKGAQVFYQNASEGSKALAELIQERLNGFVPGQYRREAKASDSYYVLQHTAMPAVIVECGFMSNPGELKLLLTDDFQNRLAWAVYMGINDYFGDKKQEARG